MESLSPDKKNIIKGIRNLFRPKKVQNYTVVKDITKRNKKRFTKNNKN